MSKFKLLISTMIIAISTLISCQVEDVPAIREGVSDEVLTQISALGFSSEGVLKLDDGYLVEGDIFLHRNDLNSRSASPTLRIAEVEQYRTNNLVTKLPRTITVSVDTKLPSAYVAATQEAVNRYNALNLQVTFSLVSSNGDIRLVSGNGSYLASAGFPTSTGDPFNSVKINARAIGNNPGTNYAATIIAHEIGHCIGFRHTDYMDRSYSCGGSTSNEGASTVGAVHIPGTPTTADAKSWMLACIGNGVDRPFNNNDKAALNYLY